MVPMVVVGTTLFSKVFLALKDLSTPIPVEYEPTQQELTVNIQDNDLSLGINNKGFKSFLKSAVDTIGKVLYKRYNDWRMSYAAASNLLPHSEIIEVNNLRATTINDAIFANREQLHSSIISQTALIYNIMKSLEEYHDLTGIIIHDRGQHSVLFKMTHHSSVNVDNTENCELDSENVDILSTIVSN